MEKIGERIFRLMSEKGYSQKELASLAGVTESAMSRYLSNEREPKAEVIANLATALSTTTDYIISGNDLKDDFAEIYRLVARGASQMTNEEKLKLISMLTK